MRKIITSFCMLLFAWTMLAQTTTVKRVFSTQAGTFTRSNANHTFHSVWKSTATQPQLTLSADRNDMWVEGTNRIHLFNTKFNLSASEGYAIKSYRFKFTGYQGTNNTTRASVSVQLSGNRTIACEASAESATVEVNGLDDMSTSFTVTGGNIVPTEFEVTLVPKASFASSVKATTIENGKFALSTVWYSLKISSQGFNVSYPGENTNILLRDRTFNYDDANLWCFVGNAQEGYRLYNRAGGVTRCLVAPKNMGSDNGGQAFVQVRPLEGLDTNVYESRWNVEHSGDIRGKDGFYLILHGTNYAANNRGGKLAFWSTGRDFGSTFVAQEALYTYRIGSGDGVFSDAKARHSDAWDGIWTSTRTPHLSLENLNNNMQAIGQGTSFKMAGNNSPTYTLSLNNDFVIDAYAFDFTSTKPMTITPSEGGMAQSITANGKGHVSVSGLTKLKATFNVTGIGTIDNFYVTVRRYNPAVNDGAFTRIVFDSSGPVPYRIPAITQKPNGDLIAVADYRFGKADIGYGPVDLHYRVSKDHGRTWGEEQVNLGDGDGRLQGNAWNYAFGDAALIADRTSDNVLVMAAGGHVTYFGSSRTNPLHVVRFRSKDGGVTWDKGTNVTEDIYGLYDQRRSGKPAGIFLTSGRIMQSRYVKVGDYYRLYIAHPVRGNGDGAYVIYSDDFGDTWHILGGPNVIPCSGKDESKVEELPDGSVVISTRVQWGGRMFNIFTYTDSKKAEGFWGREEVPENMRKGMVNACNGAILVVPAVRKADQKNMYLALQTVPQSGGRVDVGFFYKELASREDYKSVAEFVKNWQKGLRVVEGASCYSSMIKMDNDSIGLLLEEGGGNGGYDIVFKTFSIDSITNGQYTIRHGAENRIAYLEQGAAAYATKDGLVMGKALGMVNGEKLTQAKATFDAEKTQENMEAILNVVQNSNAIVEGRVYRLRNIGRSTEEHPVYLSASTTKLLTLKDKADAIETFFTFTKGENGAWKIKNLSMQNFAKNVATPTGEVGATRVERWLQDYIVSSTPSGITTLVSAAPGNQVTAQPALGVAENGKVLPSAANVNTAQWEVMPVEQYTISTFNADGGKAVKPICLPFAYTLPEGLKAYIVKKGDKIDDNTAFIQLEEVVDSVPAEAPVLLIGNKELTEGQLKLVDQVPALAEGNLLKGTIREAKVSQDVLTFATKDGVVGFYNQNEKDIPAYGVYIDKAMAGNLYALLLDKSINTGVQRVQQTPHTVTMYDLNGRRVNELERGIYIINGQKVWKK